MKRSLIKFILILDIIPLPFQQFFGAEPSQEISAVNVAKTAVHQLTDILIDLKATLGSVVQHLDASTPFARQSLNVSESLQPWFSALSLACQIGDYSFIRDIFNSRLFTDNQKKQFLESGFYTDAPEPKVLPEDPLFITWLSNPHNYIDYQHIGAFLLSEMKRLRVNFKDMVRFKDQAGIDKLLKQSQDKLSGRFRKNLLQILVCAGIDTSHWESSDLTLLNDFWRERPQLEDTEKYFARKFQEYRENASNWDPHKKWNINPEDIREEWRQENSLEKELLEAVLASDFCKFKKTFKIAFERGLNLTQLMNKPVDNKNNTLLTLLANAHTTFENHMILIECLLRGVSFERVFKDRNLEETYRGLEAAEEKQAFVRRQLEGLQQNINAEQESGETQNLRQNTGQETNEGISTGQETEQTTDPQTVIVAPPLRRTNGPARQGQTLKPSDLFFGMNDSGQTMASILAFKGKAEMLKDLLLDDASTETGTISYNNQNFHLLDFLKTKQARIPKFFTDTICGYDSFNWFKHETSPALQSLPSHEKRDLQRFNLYTCSSYLDFVQNVREQLTLFRKESICLRQKTPYSIQETILQQINRDLIQRNKNSQISWYSLQNLLSLIHRYRKSMLILSGTAMGFMTYGIAYKILNKVRKVLWR